MPADNIWSAVIAALAVAGGLSVPIETSYQLVKKLLAEVGIDYRRVPHDLVTAVIGIAAALLAPVTIDTGNKAADVLIRVVSGLVASRGSAFVHDLLTLVSALAGNARVQPSLIEAVSVVQPVESAKSESPTEQPQDTSAPTI